MCISCRHHVDVHKAVGSILYGRMWTEGGQRPAFLVDVIINGRPPKLWCRTWSIH